MAVRKLVNGLLQLGRIDGHEEACLGPEGRADLPGNHERTRVSAIRTPEETGCSFVAKAAYKDDRVVAA